MILRPYEPGDAEIIISWIKDEKSFRKWSSDRYKSYPITADDMNYKYIDCNGDCEGPDSFFPLTAVCDEEVVGHLILRYTDEGHTVIRVGFVIVDDAKRGMGYGRKMLRLAVKYAKEVLKAERLTLGVFDNNPNAYNCYKAAGFKEAEKQERFAYDYNGEKWKCIEMEMV
ncbi:MAG: GNAT family N-acetyltransferase [Eubacterium sp.]|nr:GNAT family N-acetyltransferase [Eubacterium sp.]